MADKQQSNPLEAVDLAAPSNKPEKSAKNKPKRKGPANHPKYSDMIKTAISSLKERGGSSRQALLKYIVANYNLGKDEKVINSHLKMALRAGLKNGNLKQSKGTGATGSFRLGEKAEKAKKPKSPKKVTKPKTPTKVKKPKSAKSPKSKRAATTKTPKAAKKPKSPKKATAPKTGTTSKAASKPNFPKKKAALKKGKKTAPKTTDASTAQTNA